MNVVGNGVLTKPRPIKPGITKPGHSDIGLGLRSKVKIIGLRLGLGLRFVELASSDGPGFVGPGFDREPLRTYLISVAIFDSI